MRHRFIFHSFQLLAVKLPPAAVDIKLLDLFLTAPFDALIRSDLVNGSSNSYLRADVCHLPPCMLGNVVCHAIR